MKTVLLALTLLAAPAFAADPQDGFGSVTDVLAQADGRFKYNDQVLSSKNLRNLLVELNRQLHIDRINLRAGSATPSDAQVRELESVSAAIHAELFVEHDGQLEAAKTQPAG